MSNEKILSRVKNSVTGEEYIIGTRGNKEQVALKLTVKTEVQWELFNISIQDLSDGTEQTKQLSADGECNFEIPLGNRYSITLPFVDGYTQPHALVYTASVSSRTIEYNYDNLNEYLTIRIAVRSELEEHTATMFNGLEVTCKGSNGINYAGTIQNGQVTILIPYGITYTIVMPHFDGLSHNHTNEVFKAGITARNLVYSYIDYHNLHITGLDKDGNVYTIADIQKMTAEEKTKIIAGAYNDQTLAFAPRKDGGMGCGFCWIVDESAVSKKYSFASDRVDFGRDNPIVSDAIDNNILVEGCEYHSSYDTAYSVKDGSGESALVRQVGRVLADAGQLRSDSPTPACDAAYAVELKIGEITRRGFVLTYAQFWSLIVAKTEYEEFYEALGKNAPNIFSGYWGTSSCYSKYKFLFIDNGNRVNNGDVTLSTNILIGFDQ